MIQCARFKYGWKEREIRKYDISWILGVGWRIWVASKLPVHSGLYSLYPRMVLKLGNIFFIIREINILLS